MQSLQSHFLIAMPAMGDPNFNETVTFICEHNESGALGVIINRPLELTLAEVLEQLDLPADDSAGRQPVLSGGPVHKDRGFVLHRTESGYDSSIQTDIGVTVTLSQDVLTDIAAGAGPSDAALALGCAGWDAGQLEAEMAANAWLSVPADPKIIFDTPFEARWSGAAGLLGVDIRELSAYAGHA